MNNEIKEILEIFKQVDLEDLCCFNCPRKDKDKTCVGCLNNAKDKLFNYITNLQQYSLSLAKENEQEKQFIKECGFENAQQLVLDYIGIRQEKEDYKSRIDKAIEDLEHNINYCKDRGYDHLLQDIILNILNGRSDE